MFRSYVLAFLGLTLPLYGQGAVQLTAKPIAISICKLMENPMRYQGRTIVVSGEVDGALEHGGGLISRECGGGMAITSFPEDSSDLSKRFQAAYFARLGLHDITVRTVVEGVFHANVRAGYRRIRTLDIKRIDNLVLSGDTSFVDAQFGFPRPIIPMAMPTLPPIMTTFPKLSK